MIGQRGGEKAGYQGGEAMAGATRAAWLLVVLCCCCSWTQRQILVAATTDANDGGEPECRLFFLPSLFASYITVIPCSCALHGFRFAPVRF
jgi:hypothetical protein